MINEPLIFYNSRAETSMRQITLPSGKVIQLDRSHSEYKTDDPEEIKFLSGLTGIGCRRITDAEFRGFITANYDKMPTVDKKIESLDDVVEFIPEAELEKQIIKKLRDKGYTVEMKVAQAAKESKASDQYSAPKKGEEHGKVQTKIEPETKAEKEVTDEKPEAKPVKKVNKAPVGKAKAKAPQKAKPVATKTKKVVNKKKK